MATPFYRTSFASVAPTCPPGHRLSQGLRGCTCLRYKLTVPRQYEAGLFFGKGPSFYGGSSGEEVASQEFVAATSPPDPAMIPPRPAMDPGGCYRWKVLRAPDGSYQWHKVPDFSVERDPGCWPGIPYDGSFPPRADTLAAYYAQGHPPISGAPPPGTVTAATAGKIPTWAWLAGAALAAWLVFRR